LPLVLEAQPSPLHLDGQRLALPKRCQADPNLRLGGRWRRPRIELRRSGRPPLPIHACGRRPTGLLTAAAHRQPSAGRGEAELQGPAAIEHPLATEPRRGAGIAGLLGAARAIGGWGRRSHAGDPCQAEGTSGEGTSGEGRAGATGARSNHPERHSRPSLPAKSALGSGSPRPALDLHPSAPGPSLVIRSDRSQGPPWTVQKSLLHPDHTTPRGALGVPPTIRGSLASKRPRKAPEGRLSVRSVPGGPPISTHGGGGDRRIDLQRAPP
jgi:hypothetical protein